VTTTRLALSIILCAAQLGACTALAPKNPVKAAALCGYAIDPSGARLSDFDIRLVREDQTVVAEVRTDSAGDFRFPSAPKGTYYMTTVSKGGWQLGWPVSVTGSKAYKSCSDPLIVEPQLGCGGSVSKRGYHPKF
jgi:Carboxypeptidase regulatory-like domain